MDASDAVSPARGSPRRATFELRVHHPRSTPRRRCVGCTVTMLTAAIGSRPAGHGQLERVRTGGAHDGVVVAHRVGAIGGQEMTRVLVASSRVVGSEPV